MSLGATKIIHNESFKDSNCSLTRDINSSLILSFFQLDNFGSWHFLVN